MSDEKSLEEQKREAAAKAKAAALAKLKAKQEQEAGGDSADDVDLAKKKAAAAAKAKAAALAKQKAKEMQEAAPAEETATPAEDDAKELAKKKAAAAAKAKAAALAKQKAKEQEATLEPAESAGDSDDLDLAKKKAAAAAKAKAAAAAKAKAADLAKQNGENADATDAGSDEKAKAIAAAKAKAAAAAKAKAAALAKQNREGGASDQPAEGDDLAKEKAKAIAAAKAKAAAAAKAKAAAAAKAGGGAAEGADAPQAAPSPNQKYLDKYVKVIKDHLGEDVLEDSYINALSKDVPTLVAKPETYFKIAEFLRYNEQLTFEYLSEMHGSDFETHMEIYNHFYSYKNRQSVALKVKIDRANPVIPSLQPLWEGANWPERETYDLLGVQFTGHPNMTRIMMPDEWVGHPLRKDYEPYDVEV
ncbi:MAG: NADH-quinone oxidoreductase subunit C [Bacillota bacterium]